jgi:D-sedoheptulose 7-phosphate isomerase
MSLKNFNHFYSNYKKNFIKNFISLKSENFLKAIKILRNIKNKKILIFGNGGSSSIASHASLDLTNVCNIKSLHFNDPSLITCYANDYGYENLITQSLKKFLEKEDVVILISSSGESKNMINAARFTKKNKNLLITFTGFNKNNQLKNIGDINFWVNSKTYNIVESIHQSWLLMLVDYIKFIK